MQTVQDWLTQKASDTPQPSGGLKSVSEWISTQPPTPPPAPATPPAPTAPSFVDKAITKIKDYANESADVTRAFPDKLKHPVRSFINFADTMKSEWMAGVTKAGTPIDNGNFITDISNLITGVAQASFSPVTALFKGAEAIPGIKQVADTINLPFVGLGLGGSFVAEKIVNALPDSVASKETKDVIMQPLQELGALGAQLLLGGKIMERLGEISKTKKKGEKITVEEATKVIAEAKKELPVTEVTTQPKVMSVKEWTESGMPKAPERPIVSSAITATEVPKAGEIIKPVEPIKAVDVAPEVAAKKFADEQLNSKVYERMKNENPELTGDVKYTPISLKEDVVRAGDILAKDRQEAFDIAMGKKTSPDVTSTSVNIVMAEKALQDGNVELFSRLTKKRSLDQTRRGQEIVSEKSSISDNSVSRYVRELIETRLNILGNSYLGKAVEFVTKKSPKQKATKIIDNEVVKLTTKINSRKLDVKTALDLLDKLKCV